MGMGLGFGCGDGTAGVGLVGVGVEGLAISVSRALGVPGAAGTVIVGIIRADKRMAIVAGIDLGGTAVNFTLLDSAGGQFLLDGLCEHPALSTQGPDVCLEQIADGLRVFGAAGFTHLELVVWPPTVAALDALAPVIELLDTD